MKKTFLYTIAILIALTTGVVAAQAPIVAQDFPANSNLLVNPGFENGKYGWTASAGTFVVNTTAKLQGSYGASWDAGASSQTLIANSITIPAALHGKNGLAYCQFKAASGTATHTIVVDDGSTNLVSTATITSSTSSAPRTGVNFIFPSSGSVRLKITSAADEPEMYIDSCYVGEASNVQQVSQAQIIGSAYFATTASCTFTRTNTALGALSDSDCPGPTVEYNPGPGTIQTTDANAPVVTVNNLPAGDYEVGFVGASAIGTGAQLAALAISDGTNTRGQVAANNSTSSAPFHVSAQFNYTTIGNRSFELYASSAANAFNIDLTASNQRLYFYIKKIPTSAELALRPELFNWRVDAIISGANPSLGTADQASYVGITDTSLTLTNSSGNGILTAQIPCSSTNSPSGTTCAAGDESVGVSFTLPVAGDVMACVQFTHRLAATDSDIALLSFEIVETPSNAQTITQDGKERVSAGYDHNNSSDPDAGYTPIKVCSPFSFTSAGQKTLRLFYEQDMTGTPGNVIIGDALSSVGQRAIHWDVYPISQAMPVPVLVGSVVSSSSGVERSERVFFGGSGGSSTAPSACSSSPCTIYTQSGGISSVTRAGIGSYTVNFTAGTFSDTPSCAFHSTAENSYSLCAINGANPSSTAIAFQCRQMASPNSDSEEAVMVQCTGPK